MCSLGVPSSTSEDKKYVYMVQKGGENNEAQRLPYLSLKHLIILDVIKTITVKVTQSIVSFVIFYVAKGTVNNMRFWPYMTYLPFL